MRRTILQKIEEFKYFWKHYLFQSFFATAVLFVIFLFLTLEHVVIVASIGATSFIIFAMPKSVIANPKNVIGGHLVGLISGSLCALIPQSLMIHSLLVYSFAVGVSIFIMVIIDVEHPPASGTALGVAITGFSWSVIIAIITASVLLSLIHHFFRKSIHDLV